MKDNSRFYIPTITILVLSVFVLLTKYIDGLPNELQQYVCEPIKCTVQDWISASGGLIGFLAAAVSAYLVYGQLKEQTKQTAFILGDASPTIEMRHSCWRNRRALFEVVNWNRRTVQISDFRLFLGDEKLPKPKYVKVFFFYDEDGHEELFLYENEISVPYIAGWLDRQGKPNSVGFSFIFDEDDTSVEDFSEYYLSTSDATSRMATITITIKTEKTIYMPSISEPLRLILPCDIAMEDVLKSVQH